LGALCVGCGAEGAERYREAQTESQHRRVSTFSKCGGTGDFRPFFGESTAQVSL
jgi:hypothetical protein